MRISAKIDYACKALLELSLHWPTTVPVQVSVIARQQKIPMKFLTQILITLKQLGYVQSVRGKRGGYLLAKAPGKISLGEVIRNLGGVGYSASENRGNRPAANVMDLIWEEIDRAVFKEMEQMTFESLCNRRRAHDKAFIYQI